MRALGWVLLAGTCVLAVLQGIMLFAAFDSLLTYDVLISEAFPLVPIGSVIGAAVGALIVWRYPRNTVGWLFCAGQFGNALGMTAQAFAIVAARGLIEAGGAETSALYVANLFDATYTVAFLAVIFMLVPDGTLLSRRWRWAVALAVAAILVHHGIVVALPSSDFEPGASAIEYGTVTMVSVIVSSGALAGAIVLGAVALWRRLRTATGDRRLQLLWIASSAVVLAVTWLALWLTSIFLSPTPWVFYVAVYLAYIGVSVSVGVAILRYRLFDIDVILSRAIVLGVLAVFVTVGYIVVVVAIGWVLGAVKTSVNGLFWPSIVAMALVAVAFQPLRRYVMLLADRLVYGEQAVPYEALADLSRRLADSPSPDDLPSRVAATVGRAVGASRTTVQLGRPGDDGSIVVTAHWPDAEAAAQHGATVQCPVLDRGEQVGSITVIMPPGRNLRAAECRLVDDFAVQSGLAFRNAMLQTELAARVREVDARSRELAASRRRLVGVEDVERERLAGAIQRRVVPHLTPIVAELSADLDVADPALPAMLDRLTADAEKALEELRVVVRGVFPALLQRRGLVAALSAQLDATASPVALDVDESLTERLDPAVEAAAYLFCVEVVASATDGVIRLQVGDDQLVAEVRREAGAPELAPVGAEGWPLAAWQHAVDRVEALDGRVTFRPGAEAVLVRAVIPTGSQPSRERLVAAQTSSSRSGPKADLGTYAEEPQSGVMSRNSASS